MLVGWPAPAPQAKAAAPAAPTRKMPGRAGRATNMGVDVASDGDEEMGGQGEGEDDMEDEGVMV